MINQIISKTPLSKFNITVILIIIFTTSLFNYNYIVSFETYSDSLVWGKIISKKINPNDTKYGLQSVTYNDENTLKIVLNKDPKTDFYLNNYEIIDNSKYEFGVYKSQFGIQGYFYNFLYNYVVKKVENILGLNFRFSIFILKIFQVFLLSLILVMICINIKKLYGNVYFFVYMFSFLFSPWIIKYASNLYFFTPVMFLPMLVSLIALKNINNYHYYLPLFFLAVLIKSLSGYEFLSTIMLSGVVFPIIALIDDNINKRRILQFIFLSSIFMFAGFFIAFILHSGLRGENLYLGFENILNEDIIRRTWPINSDNDGSLILTILKYFTLGWLHDNLFVGINGILFFPVIFCVTLYLVSKSDNNKNLLKFITFLSLPFSWFILAKNHSFIHYHLNTLLWYFGFIQFCLIIIIQNIYQNKNKIISIWKKL